MNLIIKNLNDNFVVTGGFRKKCARLFGTASRHINLTGDFEVSLVLTDDKHICTLNRLYRKKDTPTDVLSFTIDSSPPDDSEIPWMLGEIFISIDTCRRNALEHDKTFQDEIFYIFLHGFLHLSGFHHDTPEKEKHLLSLHDTILKEFYSLNRSKD